MNSKISRAFGVLGAFATVITLGKLNQAKAQTNIGAKGTGLADQLIDKNLFAMDSKTNEIKVDNDALVAALKSELTAQIQNTSISQDQKDKYQVILENLTPGSFNDYHSTAHDNQAMHFDGKKN